MFILRLSWMQQLVLQLNWSRNIDWSPGLCHPNTFLCLSCTSLSVNKMECPYFRLSITEVWEIYARTYYSYFYRVNYIFIIFIMHLLKAYYMLSSDRMMLYRQFVLNVSFPFKARRKVSYSYSKDFLSTVISHHVSVQHCEKCSWSVIN